MEKTIIINKDLENVVYFGKPDGYPIPTNESEAKAMIVEDITLVTEGLMTLVAMANENGYMDGKKTKEMIISYFSDNQPINGDDIDANGISTVN